METDLCVETVLGSAHLPLCTKLGILDVVDTNSVLYEACFEFRHQIGNFILLFDHILQLSPSEVTQLKKKTFRVSSFAECIVDGSTISDHVGAEYGMQ